MDAISVYAENSVTMNHRGRIVVMLYEGAIRFLKQAIEEIEKQDYIAKGKHINKACDIIQELNLALNLEVGDSDVGKNLRSLYQFMIAHVHKANYANDPRMIREVIALLEDLNEAWKAITA